MVHPGNPRLRLWRDSVRALFGNPDALPRLTPNWDKYYLDLSVSGSPFEHRSLPLDAVYTLCERRDNGTSPRTTGVTAREGILDLIANTYANNLLDPGMRAHEFRLLSRLRASVPQRRVLPHADPTSLIRLCEVILEDYRRLTSVKTHAGHASRNCACGPGTDGCTDRTEVGGSRLEG